MAWRWLRAIRRRVRKRADLAVECAALRHQVAIPQRSRSRHLRFGPWDRLLWAFLSRYWPRWREALILVRAETVLRWDRQRGDRTAAGTLHDAGNRHTVGQDTASFVASRAIAPDSMACILDVQTMQKSGGSLVVESTQSVPSRIFQVHWAGS